MYVLCEFKGRQTFMKQMRVNLVYNLINGDVGIPHYKIICRTLHKVKARKFKNETYYSINFKIWHLHIIKINVATRVNRKNPSELSEQRKERMESAQCPQLYRLANLPSTNRGQART